MRTGGSSVRLLVNAFLALLLCSSADATEHWLLAPVTAVLDGDTIEVLHNNHAKRIRLNGIDCPEKGQAYGKKAKQATSVLVFGKAVTLQTFGKDKYGRTIADVFLPDGTNVNHILVKDGWCWWYRKYAPGNTDLEKFEKEARDGKKGLWLDPTPVPPWVYRKTQRGQSLDLSDVLTFDSHIEESASSRGPSSLDASSFSSPYPVNNRRSRIYHRPDCPKSLFDCFSMGRLSCWWPMLTNGPCRPRRLGTLVFRVCDSIAGGVDRLLARSGVPTPGGVRARAVIDDRTR